MPTAPELDWNLVRSFIAVADRGSLASAARFLGLAHPTVARHVQQLEESLRVPLFDRTASGLAINEAGLRLAEVGRRMQNGALAFDAVAESVRTTTSGVVRITLSEILSELIPELLAPLLLDDGGNQRQFEIIVTSDQLNLLAREADIALRHARPDQGDLICRHIGHVAMGAFASRSYVERCGEPDADNLQQHWFIDGASEQAFSMAVERLGYHIPQERVAWRTDSMHAQRTAARAGLGVVALPLYLGDREPQLVRVLKDAPPTASGAAEVHLELWLVSRPGARQQRLLSEVGDHLAGQLRARFGDGISHAA